MRTVLVFLQQFSHISDLLHTEWIETLSRNAKVVVITPERGEANFVPSFKSPNVEYRTIGLRNKKLLARFKELRVSTVRTFDDFATVQWFYRTSLNPRRKILMAILRPFSWLFITDFYTLIEQRFAKESDEYKNLFESRSPSLVITATPGFTSFEAEAILLSRKRGIPTLALDPSWDNLSANSKHLRKTDYLIVWSNLIRKEAIKYHKYNPDKVFSAGVPRFDIYFKKDPASTSRNTFLQDKNLDPSGATLFITTVPPTTFPFQGDVIEELFRAREEGEFIRNVNFYIRVHPIDHFDLYKKYIGMPNVCVERAGKQRLPDNVGGQKVEILKDDMLNLKHAFEFSDIVLNYASTIAIEACIFDKPIVNFGFEDHYNYAYEFTHYKPIVEHGAVKVAWRAKELVPAVNAYLENPSLDKDGRRWVLNNFVEFKDGNSAIRNANLVINILNGLD